MPITDNEYKLSDREVIISATDLKGAITSTNQTFKDISGFSDEELINKNHNVVRHPDMPPEAFDDLWNTLKTNKPWMGIVKNRCKNGDYYWVDAFVTPLLENGLASGYESTRVKADDAVVKRAEKIYKAIEAKRFKMPNVKLDYAIKLSMLFSALQLVVMLGLFFSDSVSAMIAFGAWVVTSVSSYYAINALLKPLKKVTLKAQRFINNPLTQLIYTGRHDEVGQIELSLEMLTAMNRTILKRLEQVSGSLAGHANDAADLVEDTYSGVQRQQSEIEQVATAMNEMTATVQEVARNTQSAAEADTVLV